MIKDIKGHSRIDQIPLKERGHVINWHSVFVTRHLRKQGGLYKVIWSDEQVDENMLMNTGEEAILSAFFATALSNFGAPPANLYLALDSRTTIALTDTLASLVELVKSGYNRIALISGGTGLSGQDFYVNKPAVYWRADSKIAEWIAGEDWITAQKNINLVTHVTAAADGASSHLICAIALSTPRTLLNGDKLDSSVYVGLSQ